jgi:lysyl-tRNA synthetase class 2
MSSDTESDLFAQRRAKLDALRAAGNAWPNDFRRDALAADLLARFDGTDGPALEAQSVRVRIAGRMMSRRVMGKASFCHVQDMSGRIQLYVKREALADNDYAAFKGWDIGDIIGASGTLFRTKTGELSVHVDELRLLSKSLRPLPEKFHGLSDHEIRFRQRYLDLVMNEDSRRVFRVRSAVTDFLRRYLLGRGFQEVETPMMHPVPGGAAARPFVTHHNTLDMQLYLRIAPELYLKRLVIGGLEKVFEINRCFRNEGLSTRHNPEFTMLEFYQAYADYQDLMDLSEDLMRSLVLELNGRPFVSYQGAEYDLGRPFRRLTLIDAVLEANRGVERAELVDAVRVRGVAERLRVPVEPGLGPGKILYEIFEKTAEPKLLDPTFITQFPTEVSPLARRNDEDPSVVDRFELFVAGREIANGFSELNDPEDQAERFREQARAKEAGDQEAMVYDEDYITALEYGLPPTAGEGIGVDRLVMLMADCASIRDVILFPQLRPRT